tara:strand:+ start:522 stop:725 length:204 start_codon:yes stop_codon:yes gene_type:complete
MILSSNPQANMDNSSDEIFWIGFVITANEIYVIFYPFIYVVYVAKFETSIEKGRYLPAVKCLKYSRQ